MRVLEILSHRCLDGRPLHEPGVREIGTGTAAGPYHGDQTQLSPGLTALGKGNPALMFSRCGNRLGGAWAFSLEEGRAWLECLLVSAPGSKTVLTSLTWFPPPVYRLCTRACEHSSTTAPRGALRLSSRA